MNELDFNVCPKCNSPDFDTIDTDIAEDKVYVTNYCTKCGCNWTDTYTFSKRIIEE